MAASCTWKPCTETEKERAVLVKFSNGEVKNADKLNIRLFKHCDETNPRKKSRRIVVADSDRLSYVGSNFGPGASQCNNTCSYFVGVLDKTTMQMKVQPAQLFNLQPVIPGETAANAEENESKTYREKLDALIEAFGTTKQKRALSSRRMNTVGNDTLQKAVAHAANDIIDQKGLEALQQEVVDSQALTESTLFLPPCNKNATNREDVYPFDGLLSPAEFNSLKQLGEKMAGLCSEDQMTKDGFFPETVKKILKHLPKEGEDRDRQACCAWYLSFLIRLAQMKKLDRKFGEDECPHVLYKKVQKNFTVERFDNGRLKNTVTTSTVSKIASHCLALLLHIGDQNVDLTLLHRDLSISENKMLEVAKAMGLTLSRQSMYSLEEAGLQDDHRMASLELPLVRYERRMERQKRRKMK
ncbi:DNA-directed RNA polymerase I subunit RPA49 [Neoarius graeffei]|uniref:DNA-directed RNA polymerase I subunit RPA49 n=1 Tax=Neoarius graeffei TaxID=443677 RepID=UPI00298D099F|nr:DNA-directed RNA polymerase I subunit RPA49 [Neoarius graeffei]